MSLTVLSSNIIIIYHVYEVFLNSIITIIVIALVWIEKLEEFVDQLKEFR